jgi:hypothetical protein
MAEVNQVIDMTIDDIEPIHALRNIQGLVLLPIEDADPVRGVSVTENLWP